MIHTAAHRPLLIVAPWPMAMGCCGGLPSAYQYAWLRARALSAVPVVRFDPQWN